jgi:hypothetical protein
VISYYVRNQKRSTCIGTDKKPLVLFYVIKILEDVVWVEDGEKLRRYNVYKGLILVGKKNLIKYILNECYDDKKNSIQY